MDWKIVGKWLNKINKPLTKEILDERAIKGKAIHYIPAYVWLSLNDQQKSDVIAEYNKDNIIVGSILGWLMIFMILGLLANLLGLF